MQTTRGIESYVLASIDFSCQTNSDRNVNDMDSDGTSLEKIQRSTGDMNGFSGHDVDDLNIHDATLAVSPKSPDTSVHTHGVERSGPAGSNSSRGEEDQVEEEEEEDEAEQDCNTARAPLLGSSSGEGEAEFRYATIGHLSTWFPECDPEHYRAKTLRAWWSRRKTVLVNACTISTIVFLANTCGVIGLSLKHQDHRIFAGDCITTSRINVGAHVIINILSSILLGASNLCMQLLSAPTRTEIDKAHKKKMWLDIGIPSLRNVWHIKKRRNAICIVLAIASLPIHVFYNAAIYNITPQNKYMFAVVSPPFLSGGLYDIKAMSSTLADRADTLVWGMKKSAKLTQNPVGMSNNPMQYFDYFSKTFSGIQHDFRNNGSIYERLEPFDCLKRYTAFKRDASHVILVSTRDMLNSSVNVSQADNSLLVLGDQINTWIWANSESTSWMCEVSNSFNCFKPETWLHDASLVADWNVRGYKIDYCLAKEQYLGDKCEVQFDPLIMKIICIANLVKCACIYYTAILYGRADPGCDDMPLSTLGDAAASFLKRADSSTTGMSLASRANIDTLWNDKRPQRWEPKRKHWYDATSATAWLSTITACAVVLTAATSLFIYGLKQTSSMTGSGIADIGTLGFGRPNQYQKSFGGGLGVFLGRPNLSKYVSIAWANSWQLLISILYVMYNMQITAFLVGVEWTHFACGPHSNPTKGSDVNSSHGNNEATTDTAMTTSRLRRLLSVCRDRFGRDISVRKTLRVSAPVGIQRSSYFVSMPLRYGIPLITSMSLLHWLMSQSLFVVGTVTYDGDGLSAMPIYTSAYSLQAMIAAISMGFALTCTLLILGFRKYPDTIPLVSSCSAAISAACHPLKEDREASFFPLQWGDVVAGDEDQGHCALSTDKNIRPLKKGQYYA